MHPIRANCSRRPDLPDRGDPFSLGPRDPRLLIDRDYALFASGLLARVDRRAAYELARHALRDATSEASELSHTAAAPDALNARRRIVGIVPFRFLRIPWPTSLNPANACVRRSPKPRSMPTPSRPCQSLHVLAHRQPGRSR